MTTTERKILKMERLFHRFIEWALFFITGAMTLVVLLGVLFRYVLKAPLPWSEELARYLMIWGASLGASIAYREGTHIAVTILVDKARGAAGKALTRIAQILIVVFMAIVMFQGFLLVSKLSGQTSPAMEIPMAWPYLAIPIGCLFILFEALVMIFLTSRRRAEEAS
jgi:TRAP-type C4-dicarboxylate transport system permease small subunit